MFCFNFDLPDENKEYSTNTPDAVASQKGELLSWEPSRPFAVSKQHIKKILQDNIILEERSIGSTNIVPPIIGCALKILVCFGICASCLALHSGCASMLCSLEEAKIKFLSQESINSKLSCSDVSDAITYSEKLQSDLLPSVYEGGLKIWECTWDLLQYLSSSKIPLLGKRVAELGCGAGLLGIYAGLHGALITLQDYNEDVLKHVTLPNVVYNVAQYAARPPDNDVNDSDEEDVSDVILSLSDSIVSELIRRVQFYSGDWASFPQAVAEQVASLPTTEAATNGNNSKDDAELSKQLPAARSSKFDIILTSETIYNQDNYQKLIDTMIDCLEPSGVILLAAKAHYFGVGGGTASFLKAVEATGRLSHAIVAHHDQGVRREVIEIKFTK